VSRVAVELGAAEVALSRTDPRSEDDITREVEHLFVDAIERAERLIYIETQYFSSRKIFEILYAIVRKGTGRTPEIVIVVNEHAEAAKEEIAVGLRQAKNLECLREAAAKSRYPLGVYYSVCDGANEKFRETYIHSKVMAVDDRFLTVGSANVTNRSMALDSELHLSWEALGQDDRLARAIRAARVELLREHAGLDDAGDLASLEEPSGIVAFLDSVALRPHSRLQRHGPPTATEQIALQILDPRDLPFDPEMPEEQPLHGLDEAMDERYGWRMRVPSPASLLARLRPKAWLSRIAGKEPDRRDARPA
jgi:phosphatidylserine/phosphatidylglycerophosphate/cardiolipin synthase-like enzyme